MKKVEIITKKEAVKRYYALKDKAFAIAESYGTLPGYCKEPECVLLDKLASLTQLKENEGCIFIDDLPADQLTEMELNEGQRVIGKLCVRDVVDAYIQDEFTDNERLCLKYSDNIIEYFRYHEDMDCWAFEINSLGTKIKADNGILN